MSRSLARYVIPPNIRFSCEEVGQLGQGIFEMLCRKVRFERGVALPLLYKSKITPDLRAMKLLFSLRDRSDDSILLAITREIEREGIKLLDITNFTTSLLTPEGILTADTPTEDEWKDIAFGWKIAKEIGRLDIGQTVVVKNQAVMAIEAIEG